MASSFGFNDDLTPRAAPVGSPSAAVITQFTSVSTGFRTFNADGTGTAQFFSHTISPPGFFYTNPAPGGFASSGVTSGGPGRPGGSASASEQTGTFTWHVAGGRLFIEDSPNGNVFTSQRICNRERTLRKM